MIRILVAMQREAECLGIPCDVIGIGGTDIPKINPDDIIVNVGYCGGYKVPVGKVVEPVVAIDAATGEAQILERHFGCDDATCITAREFVTEPMTGMPSVYDMELWSLAKIPCRALYVLKIVSDNLDESDCEAFNDQAAWEQVRTLLKGENLI